MSKEKKMYLVIQFLVATPTWLYLWITDWKLALILLLVIFANNLQMKTNSMK